FGQIAGGPVIGAIGSLRSIRAALVATGVVLTPVLLLFARVSRLAEVATADAAAITTGGDEKEAITEELAGS
ncbi:MAG TPA: hypothetical protein VF040_12105, partial [Ktedonobacterales bacterium]